MSVGVGRRYNGRPGPVAVFAPVLGAIGHWRLIPAGSVRGYDVASGVLRAVGTPVDVAAADGYV